jgi:alpha-L-fucosidase
VAGVALALATGQAGVAGADDGAAPDYEPTLESLQSHETPQWFHDDKFGIFIHWGAYSVPAWGPRGSYAEWYWRYMSSPGHATHNHHRDTYGVDAAYDDFVDQWQAQSFDPDEWIELFEEAGARYFVLTSKHHDGVALWDSSVTGRDSVDMGPGRDLVGELFDAARSRGTLRAGLYYSFYEWYHPAYTGQPVRNPYTGEVIPYRGAPEVADFVSDHMLPQMYELIDNYDPDILWCDGQWERAASYWQTMPVIAHYYNQAKNRQNPKDVVVANRCKIRDSLPGEGTLLTDQLDFLTPEYSVLPDIETVKWESSRGIAHSYGYNANEPESDYLTSDELIDSFVDIVSKNGNLLLNVGPKADGTIPPLQAQRLRDIGAWLTVNGEAIYGTTYFNHAEDAVSSVPVRYTVKDGALYAIALEWPGDQLTLSAGLPVTRGTRVELLGAEGGYLEWHRDDADNVVVDMPDAGSAATSSEHAYVFKISTPGVNQVVRSRLELSDEAAPGSTIDGKVELTNTGSRQSADVRVALQVPVGWQITPAKTTVPALEPGESATVPITMTVAEDSQSGVYPISLSASFGRVKTESTSNVVVAYPNVALGKPATQKSLDWGGVPSRAVDGDTNGNYSAGSVTHTAEPEHEAWWQVDLESAVAIDEIEIWNRTDCCANRLSNYWVIVSESPIEGDSLEVARTAPGVAAVFESGQAGRPTRLQLDGVTGRYVRVQLESESNPLSLAEVVIRARP